MSKYEELRRIVEDISYNAELKACELLQYAKVLEKYCALFSTVVNGTARNASSDAVYDSFIHAEKDLCKAAKALFVAAKAGYDWSGSTSPQLQLKRLRR